MKLYIVRHGETTYNASRTFQPEDSPLSELGLKQAEYVGVRFKNIDIDTFLASPFYRAKQTAEIINKTLNKEIIWTELLKEMKRPSEFIGKKTESPDLKQIKNEIKRNADNPNWHYSDEENFSEFKKRASDFIKYVESFGDGNILAVTHGEFARLIITVMMLGESVDYKEYEKIHNFLKTINTGITVCEKTTRWKLLTWNDHSHLG